MNKIISLVLLGLVSLNSVCSAEEIADTSQTVEIEKSGGIIAIQKQPVTEKTVQIIKVSKCGICIIANLNGKVKDDDTNSK